MQNLVLEFSSIPHCSQINSQNMAWQWGVLVYHPASIPVQARIDQHPILIKEIWVENQPLALLGSLSRKAGKWRKIAKNHVKTWEYKHMRMHIIYINNIIYKSYIIPLSYDYQSIHLYAYGSKPMGP